MEHAKDMKKSNDTIFFERNIYNNLKTWAKQTSNYALYLEGPRQVGKTSILTKLGAEHFDQYVYINIRGSQATAHFENIVNKHLAEYGHGQQESDYGPMWESIFKTYNPAYTNAPQTLVIIDEVQESQLAYNAIRQIRRSLDSKLAISGSYLGVISQHRGYNISAGDIRYVELSSLTFIEFLKANGIWDAYDPIQTFDISKMSAAEKEICETVRALYAVYCKIGGYPDVVREWVASKDIDACKEIVAQLLRSFYDESSRYFEEVVGRTLWARTLEKVATHMVTKSGDLDKTIAKESFRDENAQGLEVRRKDKINALKWLDDCRIIGTVPVYDALERVASISNQSMFFFRDMGLMTQLCENSALVLPSDLDGMQAENFVYLHLLDNPDQLFMNTGVHSFNSPWGQIDFVMHSIDRKRYGIEVKHGSGNTKTGDKALADGKIDALIRIQNTYGSINGNLITVPIFMLDKLRLA